MKSCINLLSKIIAPISIDEDRARSEFILNILLVAIIGLTIVTFIINLVDSLRGLNTVFPAGIIFIISIVFTGLYFLSRKGDSVISSWLFCLIFFTLNSITVINHGIDVPAAILTYALIIIMTGILISTRAAFAITAIIVILILFIGLYQLNSPEQFSTYWRADVFTKNDIAVFAVMFFIIATVSWLSNREIEKSLHRARQSEAALKEERDLLEVKVEERTRELKELQLDKMGQLYRFAEFGRLSSGLFHDLVNPLTAVSLNMEIAKEKGEQETDTHTSRAYIDRALVAAHKIEDFVSSVRKQISKQEHRSSFCVNDEIAQIIDILSFKAKRQHVVCEYVAPERIFLYGDMIKFNQLLLNIIANAIDSYTTVTRQENRIVRITLKEQDGFVVCSVSDYGCGMTPETLKKVFDPFFSTKGSDGLGIGLSLVQHIIEKDFLGTIRVTSEFGHGSSFIIMLPHVTQSHREHSQSS